MRQYRGLTKDGKWVYGWFLKTHNPTTEDTHWIIKDGLYASDIIIGIDNTKFPKMLQGCYPVIPETVGQQVGFGDIYAGDYCVMDCWNGGDGIDEPNLHDFFEGVVIYDKKICRWGLQTKLCDEGQIEVGLEDNQFTSIEIIGNVHTTPNLLEKL